MALNLKNSEVERLAAELLWPFMPGAGDAMVGQLGTELGLGGGWSGQTLAWGQLAPGTKVTPRPTPLFPKIET